MNEITFWETMLLHTINWMGILVDMVGRIDVFT